MSNSSRELLVKKSEKCVFEVEMFVRSDKLFLLTVLAMAISLSNSIVARAQFSDGSTGLLQMPTAEMQADGTFMLTTNFLNKHSLPTTHWNYNTFQYGISVSFWGRMEIGYICTFFNGAWDPRPEEEKGRYWTVMRNQDRHFTGRVLLLREGEFGLNWMPALVVGVSDPTTASGYDDYISSVAGGGGYFNREFIVLSKHFLTPWGQIGAHVGYQFGRRKDYLINGPCAGMDWMPVWIQNKGILDNVRVILEYDSRTVNMGFIASIWDNHFEAMFELQNFSWINFGLRYKLRLK